MTAPSLTDQIAAVIETLRCDVPRYVNTPQGGFVVSTYPQADEFVRWSDVEAVLREALVHGVQPVQGWQPMEEMPPEGQVIVCWSNGEYDTIGRAEYLEIMGYGETPALGWMPLPPPSRVSLSAQEPQA